MQLFSEDKVNFYRRDFNRKKNIVKACVPYGQKKYQIFRTEKFDINKLVFLRGHSSDTAAPLYAKYKQTR